jgi:DNA repair exonuclease SbcCD ATPase subunit
MKMKQESKFVKEEKCNDCGKIFGGNGALTHLKKHIQIKHPQFASTSNGRSLKTEAVVKNKESACNFCDYNYRHYSKEVEKLKSENELLTGNLTWTAEQLQNLMTEHQNLVADNQKTNETLKKVREVGRYFKKQSEDYTQELVTLRAQIEEMANENKKLQLIVDIVDQQ